ncbi:translation initiation factor IF-3 [Neptunomonas phycophila]|uniref:Translation initiation factor IF-3 n=1 Tax=Neptunomonas phycophila TaxID=1572645 RepID=A0AAW7XP33_9GAMM|nr:MULTISPECIES: translation initiation factor IF-3 [Neptunomonas]MBT3146666.1 translation initiation factor IF-3 [Neptunomonas phycophila]MDN2658942.1 translation initiation factor IF-3 [Neptunomonas sp. CHC150]MDO6454560.1 translation initiation factor IF-3 [Neptunomonas phycophila]MDO6468864.1 translation initiation factor IF-3 [Neptunomonas phycophila]MDO6782868.1 translation initiation factor IF-3 [Neptunomonas phycophila]
MKRDNKRGARRDNRAPINENIKAHELRLIDADGGQVGVVSLNQALDMAQEAELDLVQISDSDPIVCKLMDYGKFQYEKKKQDAEAKKKQHQIQVKEMKFRPGTDEGDYQVKLRNLMRFLEAGDKAKVTLRFRGREMAHQELGMQLMNRIEADLEEYGSVEQRAKMEGRQMIMVIAPKKKK